MKTKWRELARQPRILAKNRRLCGADASSAGRYASHSPQIQIDALPIFHRQNRQAVTNNLYSKSKTSHHQVVRAISTKVLQSPGVGDPVGVPHPPLALYAQEDGSFDSSFSLPKSLFLNTLPVNPL